MRARPRRGAGLAARSAVQDGADALLIDVAGPTPFVVEGEDLTGLAEGWTLARVGERSPRGLGLDSARPGMIR